MIASVRSGSGGDPRGSTRYGLASRISPEAAMFTALADSASGYRRFGTMRENGGRGTPVRQSVQGDGLNKVIGDHVELIADLADQSSFGGKGREGEDGGDQSVFDQVGSAFIVQETRQKLFRTVHGVFSSMIAHDLCNWGTRCVGFNDVILRAEASRNNSICVMKGASNGNDPRHYCAAEK